MSSPRHLSAKYLGILLLLVGITSSRAADIEGIAGYSLGTTLDKIYVINETTSDDGATVYRVKPLSPAQQVDMLTLRINQQRQIHRISAFSSLLNAADCQTRVTQLRKQTEKQYPDLGYYAMEQSELFYEADRTYTLECIKTDKGIRLRQEYSDDTLAAE